MLVLNLVITDLAVLVEWQVLVASGADVGSCS